MDLAKLISQSMRKMCSSTIPMFQSQLYHHLEQDTEVNGVEGFLKAFDELNTDSERVTLLHQKLEQYGLLRNKFKADAKNDTKATRYKEKGNSFFAISQYNKALRCYTKTVMKAKNQELLAIGYANRSAALFKLGLFEECLQDIDRALANNYPDKLRSKLISRKAKSADLLKKAKNTPKPYEEPPQIPTTQRNPTTPCASNCVEIKKGKTRRHLIASRDIQIGDVLVVESPFAAMVNDAYLYHCHHCFKLCYNPICCDNCTQSVFCDEACKQNALIEYHNDECPILLSLRKLVGKNTNLLLAVKMVFYSGGEKSDEVLQLVETLDNEYVRAESVKMAMVGGFIYDLMKKYTKRFEAPNGRVAEKVFKELIMTYMFLCIVQASGVDELYPDEDHDMTQESVACAMYPFYSLFRHGCCPNVYAVHHGMKRVVRAIRTIKKGEECLASYGPIYIEDDKEDRQNRLLSQYHFKCTCRACKGNWPQVEFLPGPEPSQEDLMFLFQVRGGNVELAGRTISRKIQRMKQLERFEPRADLVFQQKILLHCFDVLGNKRLIQ